MSFIRFGTRIINTNWIRTIMITPASYKISLNITSHSGWTLFGTGMIDSGNDFIIIDKEKDKEDYEVVSQWIKKL